jgi:N-acylglucosamine 2-epimerase
MNRRHFMKASAGGAAASFLESKHSDFHLTEEQQGEHGSLSVTQADGTLAGLTLQELRDLYHRDLFDDFLPFMDRYVIDHEMGGFLCNTDLDGTRGDTQKMSWFEGRGTWVYSFLFTHFTRDPAYLETARRSIELIMKSQPQNDITLWPRPLSREGKPLSRPDTEVYGDLFIAEGLAEYATASGKQQYRSLAREILSKCITIYDRPDYRPTIGQTYLGPDAPLFPGARIQGVWMVLIRLVTQMLEKEADPTLEAIADRCLEAVLEHHYNPAFGLNNELLNHDLSRPKNEYEQLVYTGHSIETLWMLLHEAARRKDKTRFHTIAESFRRHVEVAWDDVYGGVFRNLQNVNENRWLLDKVLWAQEEVLIGSLFIVEHTGAQWAKDFFARAHTYVRQKYPLKAYGSPLWMYASDRQATSEAFRKMPKRVEHYHHPRHLMLNLLCLDRMIKRGGKVSTLLGD